MFKHPNYYKELEKIRKEFEKKQKENQDSSNKPQAPSGKPQAASVKQQAIEETVPYNDIEEATSVKRQDPEDA